MIFSFGYFNFYGCVFTRPFEINVIKSIVFYLTTVNTVFTYSYNTEGKLSMTIHGQDTSFFSYSGNTITSIDNFSGAFANKNIITLNANGMASNARIENDTTGTLWVNYSYEYNGTELIKQTTTTSDGAAPSSITFNWSGGNMVEIIDGASVSKLEYFADKAARAGDYPNLANLQRGYETFRTKNSAKSIATPSAAVSNFSYTYDADGKITAVTFVTGGDVEAFNYQYECK